MATQPNGTMLVLKALFRQRLPNAPDKEEQIIDLITLEPTVDSMILGRFAGSHNNGIYIVSGKWYWPGTTPPLVTGYCYQFVRGAGGRIIECNFLECQRFLTSSDLRNSDTVKYVNLQGDEFLDSITDKWNPAFFAFRTATQASLRAVLLTRMMNLVDARRTLSDSVVLPTSMMMVTLPARAACSRICMQ